MNDPKKPDDEEMPLAERQRVINIVATVNFCSALSGRTADPVLPLIAHELAVEPTTAALIATAYAVPYAVAQPVLGAMADIFGKVRSLLVCLLLLVVAAVISALAPNFTTLLLARVLFGVGSAGVFPIAMAMTGDLVPVNQRQVAVARLLAASMTAVVMGSAGAGIVGDVVGWRAVFALTGLLCGVGLALVAIGLRGHIRVKGRAGNLKSLVAGYREILRHPLAHVCFGAVLIEGLFIQGLFPFVAILLHQQGEERSAIAGLVLAGWGVGGVVYSLVIGRLLRRVTERQLMLSGGMLTAAVFVVLSFAPPWQVFLAGFVVLGLSFYLLHGVIQIYASELSPTARGTAIALHSASFFCGFATGPIVYGAGLSYLGTMPMLLTTAVVMFATALWCAAKLRRSA